MRLVECLSVSNPTLLCLPMAHLRPPSMSSSLSFPATSPFISRRSSFHVAGVSPLPPKHLARVSFRRNASNEDSSTEGEIEMEKNNLNQAGKASQEAWEQVLASFKEQALKLQSVSQEAYEVYFKKAVVVLKETSETLKIRADQARQDLMVMAKELGEDGKQFLTVAAENSPESVKDVVETFASAEDLNDVSKVQDFYIGIPYGTLLSAGGFLNFMITGNVSAIRFGVILGGILLALSISSLRSWRKGKSTEMTLKGQAAIAGILFLRDMLLVFQGLTPVGLLKTIISGAVAAFFIYRITYDKPHGQPSIDGEANN